MHQYSHQETLGLFLPLSKALAVEFPCFFTVCCCLPHGFNFERQVRTSLFLNARVLVLPGCNGRAFFFMFESYSVSYVDMFRMGPCNVLMLRSLSRNNIMLQSP